MSNKIMLNYRDSSLEEGDYIRKYIKTKAKVLNREHVFKLLCSLITFIVGYVSLKSIQGMMIHLHIFKLLVFLIVGIIAITYSFLQILLLLKERAYIMFTGLGKYAYQKQFKVSEIQLGGVKQLCGNLSRVQIVDDTGAKGAMEVLLFEKMDDGLLILLEFSDNYMVVPKKVFGEGL